MPKTLKSWKNEVGNNGLEVSWWKFCNWKAGCVFFFKFTLGNFKCSPPHPNPAGFQLLPGAKKRDVPKYGHHGMWRGDPVEHGYCWMRISWVVVTCCKDSKAGEFTQTTGLFSLKNILQRKAGETLRFGRDLNQWNPPLKAILYQRQSHSSKLSSVEYVQCCTRNEQLLQKTGVALGFPGLSMAPSITAQHARVRQCHSGCVLVGRCGCWVWSLNEKTEI